MPEVRHSVKEARVSQPLGDMDTKVQAYIKAVRKAGTPVNVNIVLLLQRE